MFSQKFRSFPFSIHAKMSEINHEIQMLRAPASYTKRIRTLNNLKHFRGHEFRAFVLFHGSIILKKHLPALQYESFCSFSSIMFKSNLKLMSEGVVNSLEQDLERFFQTFVQTYGKKNLTINFHELIHLPKNIRANVAMQIPATSSKNSTGTLKDSATETKKLNLKFSKDLK